MKILAGTILVVAVLAIYAHSTTAYFFDDDFHWLVQSHSFALANVFDFSRYDHFYRPVIEIYFFLGFTLFGCDPFPFHVASVVIHLMTIGAVVGFANAVSGSLRYAFLCGLFFAVHPGLTDAVTWIAAITDQLPVLWFVLTLWSYLLFLRDGKARFYLLTLATFTLCHLTHESAATLLPMMLLMAFTVVASGSITGRARVIAARWTHLIPFALVLAAFLTLAYVVNTRSYLVREGHYVFGVHALPNLVNYLPWLYVGERDLSDYVAIGGVVAAVLALGSARMRFSLLWVFITLVPVSFFTWENAPRYLYLPTVGFAMLLADLVLKGEALATRWLSARQARVVIVIVVIAVGVRFAVFAKKAADSFPARTAAYQRLAEEVRRANPDAKAGETVHVEARFLEGVPDLYREPAASVALCLPDLRLEIR